MNIQQLIKILIDAGIEPNEARCEVKMLAEHFCNYTEEDKLRGEILSDSQIELLYEKVLKRANARTPIQYIIGEAWFMGEYFNVTPDVLIPRDETEILVTRAIELIKKHNLKNVLDIGTGSGCIACTIAKRTNTTVLGVDISNDALRVALDNVTKLGINNKAVFRKSDLFESVRDDEKFDLIVSNPPYIPIGTELEVELGHEPQIALFAEDNGIFFYKKIIEHAPKYLNRGGYLILELGIGEAVAVKAFMEKTFEDIEIIKDMAGIDRVICGKLVK
jgi:release factor glutamine methyltransferase